MFTQRLKTTGAVIRSYNNPHVAKICGQLLEFGLGSIIVVVNSTADKGATKGFLANMLKNPRISVIEIWEGYSWANALNRAMMAVKIRNLSLEENQKIRYIFNVSVEALFTKSQLEQMLNVGAEDPMVGVIGTSFEGRQDGNIIDLGRSYRHPRNTGMLIRVEAFGNYWGAFDSFCDDAGGMEDIDFILAMLVTTKLEVKMLDLQVRLVVGKNYHQPTKEKREQAAMDKIIARWRSLFPVNSVEREKIDAVIAEMKLEA